MRVSDLKVGHSAKITSFLPSAGSVKNAQYQQRLMAMGLVPGTIFKVLRMAPLGDPIQIIVRGFMLSLRKFEANVLEVEAINQ